ACFFSSRRRHTRWPRDWSSDVCSSDLPGETARGLRWSLLVLRLTLRREISEPDEARAATVHDGNRPAETGRACRSARRERLVPTGLHRLADRVRARRQTREQVVARGVGHRGRIDRTADRYAPALEAGPRRCVNEHLTIDRRGPTGRAGAYATAAGHWGRSRWRRQRRWRQRRRRVARWRVD